MNRLEIKEILRTHGLKPLKRFGQNFFLKSNLAARLIEALELKAGERVVEIGPGLGALTDKILEYPVALRAFEKDEKLAEILCLRYEGNGASCQIETKDFLDYDFDDVDERRKCVVVGNLPYYITTPILFHAIEHRRKVSRALFTVQREVARRLAAGSGSKDYGRLTLSVRLFAGVEKVMDLRREYFFPPPDVHSTALLFRFRTYPVPKEFDSEIFLRVVKAAFGTRRKMLANALTHGEAGFLPDQIARALDHSGIDGKRRPEELSMDEFIALAEALVRAGFSAKHHGGSASGGKPARTSE